VVFISNPEECCAFLHQKAKPQGLAWWDYHVVLLRAGWVWDLDTTLALPCPLSVYLEASFPETVDEDQRPWFRQVPADDFVRRFRSDRGHMRDAAGRVLHPPPPWPAIQPEAGSNLKEFINMRHPGFGRIWSLAEMRSQSVPE